MNTLESGTFIHALLIAAAGLVAAVYVWRVVASIITRQSLGAHDPAARTKALLDRYQREQADAIHHGYTDETAAADPSVRGQHAECLHDAS